MTVSQVTAPDAATVATSPSKPAPPAVGFGDALLGKLGRVTSSGRLLAEVDGLRFIAISWVVLLHILDFTTEGLKLNSSAQSGNLLTLIFAQGRLGVRLFFAISGLILGLPFAEHYLRKAPAVKLNRYFLRRLTRLEPPYIINMCVMALAAFIFARHMAVNHRMSLGYIAEHLAISLVYLHNVIFHQPSGLNSVAWSLEIEVQFYILAPLLCLIFTVRDKVIRRGILCAAIAAFSIYAQVTDPRHYLSLIGHVHYFLLGILFADLFVTDWMERPEHSAAWDAIGIAAWLSLIPLEAHKWTFAEPLPVFLAYCGAFRGVLLNRIFSNRWLVVIGGMCYTIYLYHPIIVIGMGRVTSHLLLKSSPLWLNVLIQWTIMVPVILVVSSVLFFYLEKPFMRRDWYLKLFHRSPVSRSSPAVAP
jgi:peptidoglycan/LPS O-acetylase OafA/YrhL